MEEIKYLMVRPNCEKEVKTVRHRRKLQEEHFRWHGLSVRLCVAEPGIGERRLRRLVAEPGIEERRLHRLVAEPGIGERRLHRFVAAEEICAAGAAKTADGRFWTAPELDGCLGGYEQPLPGPALATVFLRAQPFRENLVLLMDETREIGTEWWQERFLEENFTDLNGLYLIGGPKTAGQQELFEWLYAQSGLLACATDTFPVTDGRKTVVVELRRNRKPPIRQMAAGSIYLDLTSDAKKRRGLLAKRTDISYISARNYLDTAFKARYNAF